MGSTIWLLSQSKLEEGSWDHSAMLEVLEQLDLLCGLLNVRTISSFVGMPGDYGGGRSWKSIRKRAIWFGAGPAIQTFQALRAYVAETPGAISGPKNKFTGCDFHQLLLEELEDCVTKVETFAKTGDPFHVSFVS
jgi:hypothetical protein